MDTKIFKVIASWAVAIFIAFIFMSLLLTVMKLAISAIMNLGVIILLLLMALPLYVIIRKKMFR